MSICNAVMPVARTGDLEVHVAVVVFRACDIAEDGVIVALLHQAHRHARDRVFQRNASIHHAERRSADGRHRGRAIRLQNVGDDAHRVRPIGFRRQNGRDRPLRQCAVSDFAAACATQERDFAHREWREVVVQHEALLGFAFEGFQPLHVFAGTECRRHQRLRFTAGEDRRPVGARQNSDFNPDIADLVELAPVRTPVLLDHLFAEHLLAQQVKVLAGLLASFFVFFRNRCFELVLELLDERVALVLGMLLRVDSIQQTIAQLGTKFLQVGFVGHDRLNRALRLANLPGKVADGGANLLDLLVAELDGLHHRLFRDFARAGLDHHDAFGRSDHHQVEIAVTPLGIGGIDDEVSVHLADAYCANRAMERDIGDAQRDRCAVDAGDVGIVLRVGRKHHGDHLRLAAETFREQRPDGPVNLAAGQNFALAGPPFALDKAAGNAVPQHRCIRGSQPSAGRSRCPPAGQDWRRRWRERRCRQCAQCRSHAPAWPDFRFQSEWICRRAARH